MTVHHMRYGRTANAIRPYSKWHTPVLHLLYDPHLCLAGEQGGASGENEWEVGNAKPLLSEA